MRQDNGNQNNLSSRWGKWALLGIILLYIAINAFHIGSDYFINSVNSNLSSVLAIGITIMAIVLWYEVGKNSNNKLLWLGFAIGWILWTVAECWWSIASILNQEIPYPSGADYFWIAGYLPMYLALIERSRTIPSKTSRTQKVLIVLSVLLVIGITTIFVFMPILADADANSPIENILNMAYPVADLFLLIFVFRIFFNYQQGAYGKVWLWLSMGFILEAISDLVYSYASTMNLYYPDGIANFISTIACDVPYNLSYLFILIGCVSMHFLQKKHSIIPENSLVINIVPNTHVLIFTDRNDFIEEVSQNYSKVFLQEFHLGKKLEDLVGLYPTLAEAVLSEVRSQKFSAERSVKIWTPGGSQSAWISGESINSPEGIYLGAIILLRFYLANSRSDVLLSNYQKGIVNSILKKSGVDEEQENRKMLFNYYLDHVRPLYNILVNEGGSIMADGFLSKIQTEAAKMGWAIELVPGTLIDLNGIPAQDAPVALPALYELARIIAVEITDEETVNREIEKVDADIDDSIHSYIRQLITPSE